MFAFKYDNLSTVISQLVSKAEISQSAYDYSLPLTAYALQGNSQAYHKLLPAMLATLNTIPDEQISFRAWLRGRVVLAADLVDDKTNFTDQLFLLQIELAKLKINDKFSSWAWGYLAIVSKDSAEVFRSALEVCEERIKHYEGMRHAKRADDIELSLSKADQNALTQELGRILWSLVLLLPAAAKAADQTFYETVLKKMRAVAREADIIKIVNSYLLKENDDYPLWFLSFLKWGAAIKKDETLLAQINVALTVNLGVARIIKEDNSADYILAQLVNERAQRAHALQVKANIKNVVPADDVMRHTIF
jgi:hypothetical protein